MRAANYYFEHLDQKVQIVVVSDTFSPRKTATKSTPATPAKPVAQQQASTAADQHAADADAELDKLLSVHGPGDFDLEALMPQHVPQTQPKTQVTTLVPAPLDYSPMPL